MVICFQLPLIILEKKNYVYNSWFKVYLFYTESFSCGLLQLQYFRKGLKFNNRQKS